MTDETKRVRTRWVNHMATYDNLDKAERWNPKPEWQDLREYVLVSDVLPLLRALQWIATQKSSNDLDSISYYSAEATKAQEALAPFAELLKEHTDE
jgi:hypothetical protein